jgi:hypothetical protein
MTHLCTAHWFKCFKKGVKLQKFDCPKYFTVSTLSTYDTLNAIMSLTVREAEYWFAVLSTPDPQIRDLKLESESWFSNSGFYGFPRFIFSSVSSIKLSHNRVQPLASAVTLSHFSKQSFIRPFKEDALYKVPLYPVPGQCLCVHAISLSTYSPKRMTKLSFNGLHFQQNIHRSKVFFIPSNSILLPYVISYKFVCLLWHESPPLGQDLLIHEVYRSHTTTHHSR